MEEQAVEILIVDDNPDDIELALLGLAPYRLSNRIKVLHDGAEALEYLFSTGRYAGHVRRDYPRIILLDLKLPLVNGLEVLRELKADPATRPIPVVMMTASQEEEDLFRSYQLGVNSYIVKSLDFNRFVEAMREVGLYWLVLNGMPHSP